MLLKYIKNNIEKIIFRIKINNYKLLRINFLEEETINNVESGIILEKYFEQNVIISLTTYSKRINTVYLTIESLFQQICRANKIILWLDEEEFSMKNIPFSLKKLIKRGLEIRFYPNIRSYKKLIPTLRLYPNDIIITVDDDYIYPSDFISNFLDEYNKNKDIIYYYCGNKIKIKNKKIEKYINWERYSDNKEISLLNFPVGVGGILYPPNCFHKDILKEELFMKLSPYGDDIWFKAMTLLMNKKCKKVDYFGKFEEKFFPIDGTQENTLTQKNVDGGKNDEQIKRVFKYYGLEEKLN